MRILRSCSKYLRPSGCLDRGKFSGTVIMNSFCFSFDIPLELSDSRVCSLRGTGRGKAIARWARKVVFAVSPPPPPCGSHPYHPLSPSTTNNTAWKWAGINILFSHHFLKPVFLSCRFNSKAVIVWWITHKVERISGKILCCYFPSFVTRRHSKVYYYWC